METFNEWQEMMEMIQFIMFDEPFVKYAKELVEYIFKHYTVYNVHQYLSASYMEYKQKIEKEIEKEIEEETEEVLNVINDILNAEIDEMFKKDIEKEIEEEKKEEEDEEEEEVDLKRTLVDEDAVSGSLRIRADVVITADGDEGYMTGSLNPNGCYGYSMDAVFIPEYILDIASYYQDVCVGSIITLSIQFKREDEVRMPWSAYYYNTKEEPETRFDPTVIKCEGDCVESNAYTYNQFVEYYGEKADDMWTQSTTHFDVDETIKLNSGLNNWRKSIWKKDITNNMSI